MTDQLRIYRIKPGTMDDYLALWRDHLLAVRAQYGFRPVGSWVSTDGGEFAWVVRYEGPGTFDDADRRYYDSPERAALPTSPSEYIEHMELRLMEPVDV